MGVPGHERKEKELKDHIIKKGRVIKTEKVAKKLGKNVAEGENIIGIIEGTEISQMRGRRTEFGQNILDAKVGGETYMINTSAVLRMANEFRFNVVQKNKQKYLVPVEKFENRTYVKMEK